MAANEIHLRGWQEAPGKSDKSATEEKKDTCAARMGPTRQGLPAPSIQLGPSNAEEQSTRPYAAHTLELSSSKHGAHV